MGTAYRYRFSSWFCDCLSRGFVQEIEVKINRSEYNNSRSPAVEAAFRARAREIAGILCEKSAEPTTYRWTPVWQEKTVKVRKSGFWGFFANADLVTKKEVVGQKPELQGWKLANGGCITGHGSGRGIGEGFYKWTDTVVLSVDGDLWLHKNKYEEHATGHYVPPTETNEANRLENFDPEWDAVNPKTLKEFWGTFSELWNTRLDQLYENASRG